MKITNPTKLIDSRTNCYSIIIEMTVQDYLELITKVYDKKGGIQKQREPLKSSSALRIRKQMVKDIILGAVLPPIVLGLITDSTYFKSIKTISLDNLKILINQTGDGNLTIIDGMQRTTALFEAIEQGADLKKLVRVEFWISMKLNNLIYRMLVLNTGQVPWNLRRQIETVFSSMINEIKAEVPELEIYTIDEKARRSSGGQYHANAIIELYLTFGSRKEKVDTRERLADEFTRLDFIEVTENEDFSEFFYQTLKRLALIDIEFSKFVSEDKIYRFSSGRDLFTSQPARVGFITAISKNIFGRPGIEKSKDEVEASFSSIIKNLDTFIDFIKTGDKNKEKFLELHLLSEKLSIKTSRVGDFEREFFTKAFDTFLEEIKDIRSMEVCWLAY